MKTFWIDLETTGLNEKRDTIIQLTALYEENGAILDGFSSYSYPDIFPDYYEDSEKIHGLSKEFLLEKGVSEAELFVNFYEFILKYIDPYKKGDRAFIGGYKPEFDFKFLIEFFDKADEKFFPFFYTAPIDILNICALCVKLKLIKAPVNYKLISLCELFDVRLRAHDATDDIIATYKIYEKTINLLKEYNG